MRKKKVCVSRDREYTVVIFLAMHHKRVMEALGLFGGKPIPDPIYPRNMVVFRGRKSNVALEIALAGIYPLMVSYHCAKDLADVQRKVGEGFEQGITWLKDAWEVNNSKRQRV